MSKIKSRKESYKFIKDKHQMLRDKIIDTKCWLMVDYPDSSQDFLLEEAAERVIEEHNLKISTEEIIFELNINTDFLN